MGENEMRDVTQKPLKGKKNRKSRRRAEGKQIKKE